MIKTTWDTALADEPSIDKALRATRAATPRFSLLFLILFLFVLTLAWTADFATTLTPLIMPLFYVFFSVRSHTLIYTED